MSVTTLSPVTEADRASLLERIHAAHRLFDLAVADLTVEQADHFERAGVLPIAFSLAHLVISQDRSMTRFFGAPLLWDAHAARVRLSGGVPLRGTPMAEAEKVRIGDMEAWRAYQSAVFAEVQRLIASAPLGKLGEALSERPTGTAFLALMTAGREPRVIDALEAWVFQHTARHVGELEHARALVGLGGVS
jgi:DinB family protein